MRTKIIFLIIIEFIIICNALIITDEDYSRTWSKINRQGNGWNEDNFSMFKGMQLCYNKKEIACHYFEVDDLNLSQPIVLDSTIAAREILMLVAEFTHSEFSIPDSTDFIITPLAQPYEKANDDTKQPKTPKYKICLLPYTGKLALIWLNTGNLVSLGDLSSIGSIENFQDYNREDLIMSMIYQKISNTTFIGDLGDTKIQEVINICEDYISNLDEDVERTLIYYKFYPEEFIPYRLKGEYIKQLFLYNKLRFKVNINSSREFYKDNLAAISRYFAYNEKIPYNLKSRFIKNFVYHSRDNIADDKVNKTDFLDDLIYLITNYPQKETIDFEHDDEIDQFAFSTAFSLYTRYDLLTADELEKIAFEVLEIDKNPRVNLQVYCALTHIALDKNDLEKAMEFALTALYAYDEVIHWNYFKSDISYNTRPAVMCIAYLYDSADPQLILETIDFFYQRSEKFPEFREFLLRQKFIIKNLLALPNQEALAGQEKDQDDMYPKYTYSGYGEYVEIVINSYFFNQAIDQLRYCKPETKIMEKPFRVKKFLLAKDSELINQEGSKQITIILPAPIHIYLKDYDKKSQNWQKAEIDGEVFWVLLEE
ncbi:MAG: hypothetical protein K9N07_09910 [Candidatus Cloacimonetes bacterium]|nr:hypothetical protein [Candidatus Cloacimonadota bacterium]